ncbi:phospholipase D family protein [Pelagibacterium montanilacus]|uniref:phospholipase D family protein n=1 Tax=Pelagibacterium montanilacus TaxID=2185280 RepID=UPI000F8CDF58|nr:phospholipase D family protein [Pelagibacterium montanilacus]
MNHFRLIDSGWSEEFDKALRLKTAALRIVCPFIKRSVAESLLKHGRPEVIEVLTRFDLNAFKDGVSDLSALSRLLAAGATIRGIKGLHSKMYLFSGSMAIVTSANLTEAALFKNREFGFASSDPYIVDHCECYFRSLWSQTTFNLNDKFIAEWTSDIDNSRRNFCSVSNSLADHGESVSGSSPFVSGDIYGTPLQSFVKFFGRSQYRAPLSQPIKNEVIASGSHWACSYPTGRRPMQVRDGAVMFMARMVQDPNDLRIYGRAIGTGYRGTVDDATSADISVRSWKSAWSHYIRVHAPVFINGPLSEGVSMVKMMEELGAEAFAPTLRNQLSGSGNTDPRRSIMRKPAMELTPRAYDWISTRLDAALLKNGSINLTSPEFDSPLP